ncbi:MAG: DUF3089 domain-containing protein [Gemmatimonadaceae bacterium]
MLSFLNVRRLACAAATLALFVAAPSSLRSQAAPTSAQTHIDYADPSTWLCRPGHNQACSVDLTTTIIAADGAFTRETWAANPNAPIDCFYIYPTVSPDTGMNSSMIAEPAELNVVRQQFARFGSTCRPFAPLYRQVTVPGLFRVLTSGGAALPFALAYADVRDAWRYYIAHDNNGRGVVLIGHSQGSTLLTQLIREEIDETPLRGRLVSAILAGTSVAVPAGRDVGGTFKNVPLCHAASQTGCAIVYASFRSTSPPPPSPMFGHVAGAGMVAACVNPAALAGGSGELHSYFASTFRSAAPSPESRAWTNPPRAVETPWVSVPGMLTAKCASNENSTGYLEITVHPSATGARTGEIGGDYRMGARLVPTWGLHLIDINLTMGNLIDVVGEQSRAYVAKLKQ